MKETAAHFVVAYDFTRLSELALRESLRAASDKTVIHILTVLERHKDLTRLGVDGATPQSAEQVQATVERTIRRITENSDYQHVEIFVHCRIGSAAEEVIHLAREVHADRIFVGTHGHTGAKRLFVGSVAETLVRKAPCPVMVMRATEEYADDSEFAPEPADENPRPPQPRYESAIQPWRFTFTRDHQVVVLRSAEWPLW